MLIRSRRAELRSYIRAEISLALDSGGARARDIAKAVREKHAGLVNSLGDELAEHAITGMVRHEIKRWGGDNGQVASRNQMVLPGMLDSIREDLPASISVPQEASDDPIYRPLFGPHSAKLAELRLAVQALWDSISADRRKAKALTMLLDALTKLGMNESVTTVTEALAKIGDAHHRGDQPTTGQSMAAADA